MKVKDIISESIIIDEGFFGRNKAIPPKKDIVSTGDAVKRVAVRLIKAAVEYNRSYEETYPKYAARCDILKRRDKRLDDDTCKLIFDRMWKVIAKENPPEDTRLRTHLGAQIS